jgi:hypothetical protein
LINQYALARLGYGEESYENKSRNYFWNIIKNSFL